MYSTKSGLVFGFHGCDQSLIDEIILGQNSLRASENDFDWLGHGVYFWEQSPSRALEWAEHLCDNPGKSKNPIKTPAVLGAILDLGHCLDFTDFGKIQLLKEGYDLLMDAIKTDTEAKIPENRDVKGNSDLLLRFLDCAVIEAIHLIKDDENASGKTGQYFDSVRGVFLEGDNIYPNAGFKEKTHIQLCIRNQNCIKGYFLPKKINTSFKKV